jgi:hypothetical protein
MDKKKVILGASLGVIGAFIYYYSNKKGKNFLKATGGYSAGYCSLYKKDVDKDGKCIDKPCPTLTTGCKTISSCTQLKLNEIKCQLRKDPIKFNKIKSDATTQKIPIRKFMHLEAMKIFTNNGQRNLKESLEYYKILPTELAERQYWEQFFSNPELQQIITGINANPSLLAELNAKAKLENTSLDRQIKTAAMRIYRQNIIQRRRDARIARQQQQQQNRPITTTPTQSYSSSTTYIPNYGNVEVHNLTPAQFNNITQRLVNDPYTTFANLREGVYQVGTGGSGASGTGGGGSHFGDSCGGYSWGTFNWSWCRTMAAMHSGGMRTGGY